LQVALQSLGFFFFEIALSRIGRSIVRERPKNDAGPVVHLAVQDVHEVVLEAIQKDVVFAGLFYRVRVVLRRVMRTGESHRAIGKAGDDGLLMRQDFDGAKAKGKNHGDREKRKGEKTDPRCTSLDAREKKHEDRRKENRPDPQ
jgi:hypothetical protein